MLKHGILGLLNYGSMTGYDVMLTFRDSLNYFWNAKTSQIYRELQTLRDKGFVTEQLIEQSGKPDKKIFSITDAGRDELKLWLRSSDFGNGNSPICMKTFFCGELSAEENIQRFSEQRRNINEILGRYDAVEQLIGAYADSAANPEAKLYWEMTLDYGKRYYSMLLEWYEANIRKMEESRG